MRVADFDYRLPPELIAQTPATPRDNARLLVVDRNTGRLRDQLFRELPDILSDRDILVLNDTRVIPARIYGTDHRGRRIELMLLREIEPGTWEALSRPSRRARVGVRVSFGNAYAEILEWGVSGVRKVRFSTTKVNALLNEQGEMPLPPYIRRPLAPGEAESYQTVYARKNGAVAAPTAGLHFTEDILSAIRDRGTVIAFVTLHASLGTFRPVRVENVEEHKMYQEEFEISPAQAQAINRAIDQGKRIVAVGTTVVRALETQARESPTYNGENRWYIEPARGLTELYIYPGYRFRIVGALLTNFHLPRSTLLMLVCAFAGRELISDAYQHAIAQKYRFYSFGDAMLII